MAVTKQVKQVKFWGKILGRDKDYYIAEGILEGDDGVELPPNVEPKGQGINKMNYWVTNDRKYYFFIFLLIIYSN